MTNLKIKIKAINIKCTTLKKPTFHELDNKWRSAAVSFLYFEFRTVPQLFVDGRRQPVIPACEVMSTENRNKQEMYPCIINTRTIKHFQNNKMETNSTYKVCTTNLLHIYYIVRLLKETIFCPSRSVG